MPTGPWKRSTWLALGAGFIALLTSESIHGPGFPSFTLGFAALVLAGIGLRWRIRHAGRLRFRLPLSGHGVLAGVALLFVLLNTLPSVIESWGSLYGFPFEIAARYSWPAPQLKVTLEGMTRNIAWAGVILFLAGYGLEGVLRPPPRRTAGSRLAYLILSSTLLVVGILFLLGGWETAQENPIMYLSGVGPTDPKTRILAPWFAPPLGILGSICAVIAGAGLIDGAKPRSAATAAPPAR